MASPFSQDRWQQLSALLDGAWDLPRSERGAWLDALRDRDPELAAEVEALLADHAALKEEGFLESAVPVLAATSLAGHTVGAYTLRSEIGLGGMGSVWLAERTDGRFSGRVAVKLLNASHLGRQGEARFRREGSILARLRHPHIAHLVDAGISVSGQPYLVLEYVEGRWIDAHCDDRALGIDARVRLFLDVLGAVAHAHSHLVVHRDIKPSNVLVADDGVVKLLDFGIAKLLEPEPTYDGATALTRDGEAVLTPEYAAPEQLTGGPVTTRTDVYALGVLLYVLLSGRHPSGGGGVTPAELVRAVVDEEPVRLSDVAGDTIRIESTRVESLAARRGLTPRRLQAAFRGDLDNIVAKALKKDPDERYDSVDALAADLRRYLNQEPVRARPDSLRYRTAKFVRRNRTAVVLGALAVAASGAGVGGTLSQARRARQQAALAEAQRARADREAASAREQRDFALREVARGEAVNELNSFLLTDAAPAGRAFTVGELLARAEAIVRRQHGEGDDSKADLLVQVGEQYLNLDDLAKAETLLADAYALARAVPSTRARAACTLADVRRHQGDTKEAERLLKEGLSLLPDQPQYAVQRVLCLLSASQLAIQLDAGADGVARAEEAVRVLRAAPMPSVLLDLDLSAQLARAYRNQGRFGEAAKTYERAFALLDRLGRVETDRGAAVLGSWSHALEGLGQHLEAERLMRRAVQIVADGTEPDSSPVLQWSLAGILRELNHLPEAARLAERSQDLARRLEQDTSFRRALMVRASVSRMMGRLDRAARLLDELEPLLRRAEVPTHSSFAFLASERAALAMARGDLRTAADAAERAVSLAEGSGQRLEALPLALLRRAGVELAAGRADRSLADGQRALELWQSTGAPGAPSSWQGLAHLARARALLALGREREAQASGAEALRHLVPTLGAGHPATSVARQLAG